MSKSSNTFMLIAGAGIGAALGLLFAPDTGKNTRDRLSYQLSKYSEDLEELIKNLRDGKNLPLNEAKSEGNKVISEAKNKAENLLSDVNKLIDQINRQDN
ncbi:gas vesicle protein [Rhodonellum psychrophilum GCM71 = DSM 17998]|uniref:Gas vesicle protein n=2 Tax=Rhodonellum TaxID=336827 RepID=U5BXD1_9BACT|nr:MULTISPECIES: YtxH domain-containing protein [Rhodonellum]ERM82523.1 gas vesicle protein [Rhodonellum psychrophilum GCM71 = DSM 17998]MDO9552306.1 YtxH domain-containing protein [Rhodonellum sp.]SDY54713.1 Gas vesicle protein [Rhodonellum ikkaensis]